MDNQLQPKDALDFITQEFTGIDSWWGDALLCPRSKLLLTGSEGIGKSLLAVNLAISLSTGQPFLGFSIPEKKKVLYLNFEISERNLQKRAQMMFEHIKPERGLFYIDTILYFDINSSDSFGELKELVRQGNYDVFIIDCFYKIHNGDENTEKDIKSILDKFDYLIREFGISIVLVHHHNKNWDVRGSNIIRGSSVLAGWADTIISLHKKSKEVQVVFNKVRNAEAPDSIFISKNNDLWFEKVGKAGKGIARRLSSDDLIAVFKEVDKREMTQPEICDITEKKHRVSESTVIRALKYAKQEKKLFCDNKKKPNKWYLPLNTNLSSNPSVICHVTDRSE